MKTRFLSLVVMVFASLYIYGQQENVTSSQNGVQYSSLFFQILATVTIISGIFYGIIYGVMKFYVDYREKRIKEYEIFKNSFDNLVEQLTSDNKAAQLSAAILLRRYFKVSQEEEPQLTNSKIARLISNKARQYLRPIDMQYKKDLRVEAIFEISTLLKTLPTSVFQKTLADGLGFATDLSCCDLVRTNLQDVLLDNKKQKIDMEKTDLFRADLSYANLEGIIGHEIIFYHAILFCARIKECDFTRGDFRCADLTGVSFYKCTLEGANFKDAINIPPTIAASLEDGIFTLSGEVSAKHETKDKAIFFSMPGVMSKNDELITKNYKQMLERKGYEVIYYMSDDYPRFGQFNSVRHDIMRSSGMVAFGLKQIHIPQASYRPGTKDETIWNGKWFSTPWNEIEVGMGLMKGMPILLVCDPDINDGVFDDGLSECFVAKVYTTEDSRRIEYNYYVNEWLSKL